MSFDPPLHCPWECHLIGGPWISENPQCPFHGSNPVDCDELDKEEGERMCREEDARREEREEEWKRENDD